VLPSLARKTSRGKRRFCRRRVFVGGKLAEAQEPKAKRGKKNTVGKPFNTIRTGLS